MQRALAVLVVLALLVSVSQAADPKPITKSGTMALLFDLGGLANLSAGTYQGGLGFKYFIGNNMAIRAGLGFSTTSATVKNPTSPTPAGQLDESKLSDMSFSIVPGFQYYLLQTGPLAGYAGAQISFKSTSRTREGSATDAEGFAKDHKFTKSTTEFGLSVFGGFEWFPWSNISFSGEYRIGFGSSSTTEERKTANTTAKIEGSGTVIGTASGNAASLTLSVYL